MNQLLRRLQYLLNFRRRDEELAREMEFHREMAARGGHGHFGNSLRLREEARDAWGWTWIDRLFQDLRYATRLLRKSPGFTAAAVMMLAIGIGANVAAFGFFNLLVLRPMAVRDPSTLLRFERRSAENYASALPYPEVSFFREHSRTLSAVLGVSLGKVAMEGEQKPLNGNFVTANLFTELGATARVGRALDPERDEAAGAEPVVVLSDGFWQRHYAGDPAVVGRTIRLNGKPATIVGVARPEFSGLSLDKTDVWMPISQAPYFITGSPLLTDFSVDGSGVRMWGRLQPGLSAKAAEGELRSLAAELRKLHPNDIWEKESLPSAPGGYAMSVSNGNRHGSGAAPSNEMYPILALVATLVLLILAVACGNLGSLLLARGVAREREISIRVAVGAGRARLIRQLFTESVLLGVMGSAAGLVVGYLVLHGLMLWTEAPAWLDTTPDWRVMVFALGVGFAAAILFGLTPALQVARQRHRATLMRQVLLGAQVAGSCVLVIVAGLLVRALDHAMFMNPGFAYEQVVSIDPGLANNGYSPAMARAYLDTLQSRLRGLPGVESVSLSSITPLGNKKIVAGTQAGGRSLQIHMNHVDPRFFETMKIPILRGRALRRGDVHALIISESFARAVWPAEDPLGKDFQIGAEKDIVVGVAGSARTVALQDGDAVEAYFPAGPEDLPAMVVLVKTTGQPEGLLRFLAATARSIDAKVFPEVQMLKSSYRRKLQGAEYSAIAVGVLGGVALLLACLGIVGLVAYAVSQRTKEIGIRMALGAKPSDVLLAVLSQLSRPVIVGLVIGVGGAAAFSQILRGQLYGISNLDPLAYVGAVGVFIAAVVIAGIVPARRALLVDPLRALRYE